MLMISTKLVGITPLICNRFHDAAAQAASGGTRGASAAADRGTPKEICALKLYYGADNQTLIIPQPNLMRCLIDGGRFHKVGKSQLTTATGSMLFACVDIPVSEIPLVSKSGWNVDTRAVVIPATKGRILMHRPIFEDWSLTFDIELDTSLCSEKLLRMVIDDAGKRIGLGDFRPAKKGPYGRFRVDQWESIDLGDVTGMAPAVVNGGEDVQPEALA